MLERLQLQKCMIYLQGSDVGVITASEMLELLTNLLCQVDFAIQVFLGSMTYVAFGNF